MDSSIGDHVTHVIPAFSSGQNNLHPPIWGPSRQLDDQHRNTNMKNKDHLVGQLTCYDGDGGVTNEFNDDM